MPPGAALGAPLSRVRVFPAMRTKWCRLVLLLVGVSACGAVTTDHAPDGGGAARCSPTAPFETPRLVPGADLNTTANEFSPRLTLDELGLYFARSPGMIGGWDIYAATRTEVGGDF